jgi:hypothetical protein
MATSTKMKKTASVRPAHWLDGTQSDTWHPSAPADVVEAYTEADGQEGWEAWTDYLDVRRGRPSLGKLLPSGEEALLWAMPTALVESETAELLRQLGRSESFEKRQKRRRWADVAADWLDAASIATASPAHAYECLAWAYALTRLPNCVGENLWWKLINHFTTMAREARQVDVCRDPLVWQMLAGELPLALSYLIPEIRACHDHSLSAWSTIVTGLNELVDVDGIPKTSLTLTLPALVASWTRSRAVAERLGSDTWQEPASRRYELALLSLARLHTVDAGLWNACEQFELEKPTRRLMRQLASGKLARRKTIDGTLLPSPAMHSEEFKLGVLRSTWISKAPRLTVSYSDHVAQFELTTAGEILCSGPWHLEVSFNDELRTVCGNWETVCWHSDQDVDFLEIEASLGEGLRVQRQLVLAREDEILLVADAVLSDRPGRIECRASLPVCTHIGFHGAEQTREGHLVGHKTRALVLPLGLPEWRSDSRRGSLEMTSTGLTLRQLHEGRAAYIPLLIDLNAKRTKQGCTWRQLTLAERCGVTPGDVAVGYRAQVDKTNWLIYRSLAEMGIRSLLGQQVKSEFLFGRMKSDGGCVRLLEVEPIHP